MNILERLKTRFDPRIVQPDEMAREAHDEIERLRTALNKIATTTGGAGVPIARAALRPYQQSPHDK